MFVPRIQTKPAAFMPMLDKSSAKVSDAAKKLSEVKFDILPKRAVSDPQKDSFVRKCAYGDNPDGECFSAYGGFVC